MLQNGSADWMNGKWVLTSLEVAVSGGDELGSTNLEYQLQARADYRSSGRWLVLFADTW